MATAFNIEIPASELAQIVESVFETMMSLEVGHCEAAWSASRERVISAVHLTGDWNGALLLECDQRQACRFAGRFLSIDPPETIDDVVRDVLGELANMIGGNMKSAMIPGIRLSLPAVVDGHDYFLRVCGAEVQERLAFRCAEGLFWVSVLATPSSDKASNHL